MGPLLLSVEIIVMALISRPSRSFENSVRGYGVSQCVSLMSENEICAHGLSMDMGHFRRLLVLGVLSLMPMPRILDEVRVRCIVSYEDVISYCVLLSSIDDQSFAIITQPV